MKKKKKYKIKKERGNKSDRDRRLQTAMGRAGMALSLSAVVALDLKDARSWWDNVNESPLWQDRIFHLLAILYGFVAAVALVCNSSFDFGIYRQPFPV